MDLLCVQGFTSQNSKMDFRLVGAILLNCDSGKGAGEQGGVSSANKNKAPAVSEAGTQDLAEGESGSGTKEAETEEEKCSTLSNGGAGINEAYSFGESAVGFDGDGACALSPFALQANGIQSEVKWHAQPMALEPKYEFHAQDFSPNWEYVGSLKRCADAYPDLSTILDYEEEGAEKPNKKRVQFTIGDNDDYSSDEEWGNPHRFRSNLCTIWEDNEGDEEDEY